MASCNLSFSGHTGVLKAKAYVTELNTSGTKRQIKLRLVVYAIDYSGARDASCSVTCAQSGTNISVPMYSGFSINGDEQEIFNETFYVNVAKGASSASISLAFSASIYSSSAGANRTITGSITTVNLTPEASADASSIRLGTDTVQMGNKLLISIDSDEQACTHELDWQFGGSSGSIAKSVGTSCAWTVPDLANLCSNELSGSCTIVCRTYLKGEYLGSSSALVTLTVPDATWVTMDDTVTMGTESKITCPRNSSNFTLKIEFEFKSASVLIAEGQFDDVDWTPAYDLAKQIPNLTSGTGTLKCTTMNGTAQVGTTNHTITAVVPENDVTKPRFTADDLEITPISDLPDAFAGLYLRGKTGLRAEMSANSEYSTIKGYSITVGVSTAEGNPAIIPLLVNEGDVKVIAKVTDARGFITTVTTTVQILPYRNPKITPYSGYSNVICERATETGELSPKGIYLAIKAGKSFSSINLDGKEQNFCSLRYRWKPNNVTAFSEWITLLEENSKETNVSLLIGNIVSSLQTSYTVELVAHDALNGEHKLTFPIMTEAISFKLYDGPDGAAFGKHPEEPHVVDIASHMTLLVRGKLRVLGDEWVSVGLASLMSESGDFGRKETGCFYLVTEGRHVHIAFNCSFSYAGTALIVNATPIPEEHRPDRKVFSLCPTNDRQIACISVDSDGYIRVEWVQKATDTVLTGTAVVTWIDGYLCYWT